MAMIMAGSTGELELRGAVGVDGAGGRGRSSVATVLVVVWVVVAAAATAAGLDYYRLPPLERAYSGERALFAPTGAIGHSLGYVGTLMVVLGVGGYVARRRFSRLASWGRLSTWLQVHIFLCTLGPYLVLLHTSFKFGGIAAISFWSMVVAVASGVFGRYVYVRIPRTLGGQARTVRSVETERAEAAHALAAAGGPSAEEVDAALGSPPERVVGIGSAMARAVGAGLRRRAALLRLRRLLDRTVSDDAARDRMLNLADARLRAEQQIAVLIPFQRLFRYWHVLHLPIAIVMFAALAVHLTVAVLFGYAWPFRGLP
jgi:hypothetical protein